MPTSVQDRLLIAISSYIVDRRDETFQREFAPLLHTPESTARTIVSLAGGWAELSQREWELRGFTAEQLRVDASMRAAEASSGELAQFNAYRVYSLVLNGDIPTGWALAMAAVGAGMGHACELLVAVAMEFVAAYDRITALKAVTS